MDKTENGSHHYELAIILIVMPIVGLLIFPFWTPHFVVWTPHFLLNSTLNYTVPASPKIIGAFCMCAHGMRNSY